MGLIMSDKILKRAFLLSQKNEINEGCDFSETEQFFEEFISEKIDEKYKGLLTIQNSILESIKENPSESAKEQLSEVNIEMEELPTTLLESEPSVYSKFLSEKGNQLIARSMKLNSESKKTKRSRLKP